MSINTWQKHSKCYQLKLFSSAVTWQAQTTKHLVSADSTACLQPVLQCRSCRKRQPTYTQQSATILQVNLHYPAPSVKNWRTLLVQSFTAHMPLLTATSASGLGRRCWSSQQCYLHCLHTIMSLYHTIMQTSHQKSSQIVWAQCNQVQQSGWTAVCDACCTKTSTDKFKYYDLL